MYKGKLHETEDVTPTWQSIIHIYLNALEYGDKEGKEAARHEIRRLAKIADQYNELIKAKNK